MIIKIKDQWLVFEKIIFLVLFLFLQSCASSDLSRSSANKVDAAYAGTTSMFSGTNGTLASVYQNTSQATKGAVIGGAAGAVAGGLTTGVGVWPGAAVGAVGGGAFGAYIDGQTSLVDKLENRNVKVIVLGDQVLLVLSSAQIFSGMSPTITCQGASTLDLVAQLMSGYTKMLVKVAAYTNGACPNRINVALSNEQAQSIVKYLWHLNTNTRLLYATGCGAAKPVTKVTAEEELGANYRVEITFEKLPT